jgi:ubiquinone/menaquinone biosynthesis C-methylase UbiE
VPPLVYDAVTTKPTSDPSDRTDVTDAYDRWAASYDADKNTTRDLDAQVVRKVPLQIQDLDVLELGSGTGKNTQFLAEHARSVVAIDVSEAMIARAHSRIPTSNVRFVKHDVRDTWPIQPASVDAVVANLILEHVHDLAPVFFEAARVLRPQGQFFFCELHPYRQLAGGQAHFVDPETGELVRVAAHVHTVSEYVNGAIEAGFTLKSLGEWTEDDAPADAPPRLISLLLERA